MSDMSDRYTIATVGLDPPSGRCAHVAVIATADGVVRLEMQDAWRAPLSFIRIADPAVLERVAAALTRGARWLRNLGRSST